MPTPKHFRLRVEPVEDARLSLMEYAVAISLYVAEKLFWLILYSLVFWALWNYLASAQGWATITALQSLAANVAFRVLLRGL